MVSYPTDSDTSVMLMELMDKSSLAWRIRIILIYSLTANPAQVTFVNIKMVRYHLQGQRFIIMVDNIGSRFIHLPVFGLGGQGKAGRI